MMPGYRQGMSELPPSAMRYICGGSLSTLEVVLAAIRVQGLEKVLDDCREITGKIGDDFFARMSPEEINGAYDSMRENVGHYAEGVGRARRAMQGGDETSEF